MARHRLQAQAPASQPGLIEVDYELHQTRGKTKSARRSIALDATTLAVLRGWRAFQTAEFDAVGIDNEERWVFTDGDGNPVHPQAVYQAFGRIVRNSGLPHMRFHDLRHTHASLLIKEGSRSRSSANGSVTPTSPTRCRPTSTCSPACRPTQRTRLNASPAQDLRQTERRRTARWNVEGTAGRSQPEDGRSRASRPGFPFNIKVVGGGGRI